VANHSPQRTGHRALAAIHADPASSSSNVPILLAKCFQPPLLPAMLAAQFHFAVLSSECSSSVIQCCGNHAN
jgi:hypothetical protein